MNIVKSDNFEGNNKTDILVAENVSDFYLKEIINFLNANCANDSNYFKSVEDNNG